MTREDIKTITDIVHKTIYGFFDVCGDDEETPMTDKDKLLLKVNKALCNNIKALEQEPKTGHCKDCKWWKDSDGVYRRGCGAESKCPINRREVFEGNAYCYLYEPQESEG